MELRRCVVLLLVDILVLDLQYYVLADNDPEPFLPEDDMTKQLHPLFEGEVPEDACKEPETPTNGDMQCGKLEKDSKIYICRASCDAGFEFPNRKKKGRIVCDLNPGAREWSPNYRFPNCRKEIVCNPPCVNGGVCKSQNNCTCPPRYTGKTCKEDKCKEPPSVPYGKVSCKISAEEPDRFVCEADCREGFQFANKKRKESHTCNLKTGEWQPKREFPACERICNPPCQNGGTCLEGNVCFCTGRFKGEKCEIEVCKDPPIPTHGKRGCNPMVTDPNTYACTAECLHGYNFPSEEKRKKHTCNLGTGLWEPAHEFPDCQEICNPVCQNGGKCVKGNKCNCTIAFEGDRCDVVKCNPACENGGKCIQGRRCECPVKFTGERCQYENCRKPVDPFNGKVSCRIDGEESYSCQAECNPGYQFSDAERTQRHTCDLKSGEWMPEREFPDCKPTCNPRCQNGGQCLEGNRCFCSPQFKGERCERAVDTCKDLPSPANGRVTCNALNIDSYQCILECQRDYYLPNGLTKQRRICDMGTGKWMPEREFPDCKLLCNPLCENGGECIKGNKCDCKPGFSGERCQDEMPGPCVPEWTEYFNTDHPDDSDIGDDETLRRIRRYNNVCDGRAIIGIECKAIVFGKRIDYEEMGTVGLKCSTDIGFTCDRRVRQMECEDYSVRFLCDCADEPRVPVLPNFPDVPVVRPKPPKQQMCPEIPSHLKKKCPASCRQGYACDGSKCVPIDNCLCYSLDSGFKPPKTEWNTQNCQRCECLTGGRSRCGPIVCPDCLRGEISEMGPDCQCTCRACPAGTVLCPSIAECISEEALCGGEVECPGVEIICPGVTDEPVVITARPKPPKQQMCPEVPSNFKNKCPASCRHGYACDGFKCVPIDDCGCFTYGSGFKQSKAKWSTENCQRCECLAGGRTKCDPIVCPDCLRGEKSVMGLDCKCTCIACPAGFVLCPSSADCISEELLCKGEVECPEVDNICREIDATLPPNATERPLVCSTDNLPDTNTCEMMGNVFETFDGSSYQYEICNQVLMKELTSQLFSVTVHKTCNSLSVCSRHLVIRVDDTVIKLGPGIRNVAIKNTKVPVSSLWLVSQKFPDLELKMNGNTLLFKSFKHHFDVVWDGVGNARIKVSTCLTDSIVGLCGIYNTKTEDDLTMPDGNLASGGQEFGDSWTIGSLSQCKQPKYSLEITKKADDTCNKLREEPFNPCIEQTKVNRKVEACTAFMLECLQRSSKDRNKGLNEVEYEKCKCQAYESFVENCEIFRDRPAQEWRILHSCTPTCPKGMEWEDCGPGCVLTCDNYHQRSKICSSTCVRGCYCPAGLVRHRNQCVKPKMCQDCICRGHGDSNFITFDGRYYAFQGTCTYVLAQHLTSEDNTKNFRILATNVECPQEPSTSCIQHIKVVWNDHVIEKRNHNPVNLDGKPLKPEESPFDVDGISISYVQNKSTWIHISEINLVVRYFDQMYGFSVELPSFTYYNQTEGLCGVCNFVQSDDLYHRNGYVTDDIEDFVYSWLEGPDTRRKCELPRTNGIEPPPGFCDFTASPCDAILDPSPYLQSCLNDVRRSLRPDISRCRSKFQYAQQCCERGVPLDEWLKLNGCDSSCPSGMVHKCTSACPKTCDNYLDYQEDSCLLTPQNTCVCPEGKVLKLGQCVEIAECKVCDAQGHVIDDVWKDGPCKTCECLPDLSTRCTVQECPQPPVCEEREELMKLKTPANSCCETYKCVFKPRSRSCSHPELELCPPGKAYVKKILNGCPVYHCECFPELCPPSATPDLEDGEKGALITTGCCPTVKRTCNPMLCSAPPKCHQGFKLSAEKGRCCNKYVCVPQRNVCTYEHRHVVLQNNHVNLPVESYYVKEYEPGSSWQDGLCKKCTCLEINGRLTSSCKEEICLTNADFPDADKYTREEIRTPGFCCPRYVRKHCLDRGTTYKIGDEWKSPSGRSCNKTSMCVRDQNGEALSHVTFLCERNCK